MQGRPVKAHTISSQPSSLLTKLAQFYKDTNYKFDSNMTDIFKKDAFLYLAFIAVGFATASGDLVEKVIFMGTAILCLVLRSVLKNRLSK
jgi:hypothetical protein